MANLKLIQAYVHLTRPQNATASVLALGVGYCLVPNVRFSINLLAGLIIGSLLHSAVTVQNDLEDFKIDKANHRQSGLLNNSIGLGNATNLVTGLFLVAILIGFALKSNKYHLIYIAAFLTLSWLYNSRPAQLSRRPISSIFTLGLCYGLLPISYGYGLANGQPVAYSLLFMGAWFLQRCSISILKDYKDCKGDKLHGKRTFYLVFGNKLTAWISVIFCLAAYASVTILLWAYRDLGGISKIILLAAMALAIRNIWLRIKLLKTSDDKKLATIFKQSFLYNNQFEAVILLCLIAS